MHLPELILDLAVILSVAAFVTFLFRRIKQPVVLGYIFAGIIVGPHTPAIFSVSDMDSIKVWAELGVIFLMFSLGLEFSFRRLAKVGVSALGTGVFQIAVMLACGVAAAKILSWSNMDAIFLGCMIAISSTTIIIKAFEELGLQSKKFAELVFGILIVEDLAAILMLVMLTNLAVSSSISGMELLVAGGKLGIVVAAWLIAGIFLVPRLVRAVSKHGNNEMLTLVAAGLCLSLVAFAASFHYSAALGAFIMGSILAESSEARRIEHLIAPLKDIFGAVFFVSVGMLLDPRSLLENWLAILVISVIIILGKVFAVVIGAFLTGQTVKNSIQTGLSMAQIGEFSFIIATLGLATKAIEPKIYPVIVAASLVTTFTTPYLIKISPSIALEVEKRLPTRLKFFSDSYVSWLERQSSTTQNRKTLIQACLKWLANAIVVVSLFTISAEKVVTLISVAVPSAIAASGIAWAATFLLCSPSLWAMFTAFRNTEASKLGNQTVPRGGLLFISRVLTIILLGFLGVEFFPTVVALGITSLACAVVFIFFRQKLSDYYKWLEYQFQSGFETAKTSSQGGNVHHNRLAPWDAHLVSVVVPLHSFAVGHTLQALRLREQYGLNVVIIMRNGFSIVSPKANERIFAGDELLCFATDDDIERFKSDLVRGEYKSEEPEGLEAYGIRQYVVHYSSKIKGTSIRASSIRETYECIVVGLERDYQRMHSPSSDLVLQPGDVLWIVGTRKDLDTLAGEFAT